MTKEAILREGTYRILVAGEDVRMDEIEVFHSVPSDWLLSHWEERTEQGDLPFKHISRERKWIEELIPERENAIFAWLDENDIVFSEDDGYTSFRLAAKKREICIGDTDDSAELISEIPFEPRNARERAKAELLAEWYRKKLRCYG